MRSTTKTPPLPPTAYDAVPRVRVTLTDEAAYLARFDQRGHLSGEYPIDLAQVAQAFNVFGASTGLLDERTLFWQTRNGQTRLGVWLPPQRRTLAYTAGRGEERLTLPLPGFVFVGQGTRYGIWAAAKRPRGSFDHLCHAPLPNVHTTGLICAGNVRFPVCDIGTIHRAAELFFESDFNADLSADKVTYHGPLYKFWKSIQRAKHFPSEKLIHHTTIATLMNADF